MNGDFCLACLEPLAALADADAASVGSVSGCGHRVHLECLHQGVQVMQAEWRRGKSLRFNLSRCLVCLQQCVAVDGDAASPINKLLNRVAAVKTAVDSLRTKHDDKAVFYLCTTCDKPFFGGLQECEEAMNEEQAIDDGRELSGIECLRCQLRSSNKDNNNNNNSINTSSTSTSSTTSTATSSTQLKIGNCGIEEHIDSLVFKCRFCCAPAAYFCFGTTHFCKFCHDNDFSRRARGAAQGQSKRAVCHAAVGNCPTQFTLPPIPSRSSDDDDDSKASNGKPVTRPVLSARYFHKNGTRHDCETVLWCNKCSPQCAQLVKSSESKAAASIAIQRRASIKTNPTDVWCRECAKFCAASTRYKCVCGHYRTQHERPSQAAPAKRAAKKQNAQRRYVPKSERRCACGCSRYEPWAGAECKHCFHVH